MKVFLISGYFKEYKRGSSIPEFQLLTCLFVEQHPLYAFLMEYKALNAAANSLPACLPVCLNVNVTFLLLCVIRFVNN